MLRVTVTWRPFCPFYSSSAILAYVNQFKIFFASEFITLLKLPAFLSTEQLDEWPGIRVGELEGGVLQLERTVEGVDGWYVVQLQQ